MADLVRRPLNSFRVRSHVSMTAPPPGHKCPGYAKQLGEPDCWESPSGGSFD